MKKSAENRIVDFLKENPTFFPAAQLQRMSFANKNGTLASPKAISRRLQELAEGEHAILDVEYPNGHAHYKIKQEHRKVKQVVERLSDNTVRVSYVAV